MNKIALVRRGNLASIALDFFTGVVRNHQSQLLQKMMTGTRDGTISRDNLFNIAAGYTALEDVLSTLDREVRNSAKAEKEHLSDPPGTRTDSE